MEEDRKKTDFTTPWGTFVYEKMPFGLMNAGETFHRDMDIAFIGEKDRFVVIYLDDITVFSTSDEEHLQHLKNAGGMVYHLTLKNLILPWRKETF
jgi:hypothetical protein